MWRRLDRRERLRSGGLSVKRMIRIALGVAIASALGAGATHAGDGRLEINQSCIATGCFPGDAPGFPVETQEGKSYVLTSSLERLVPPSVST